MTWSYDETNLGVETEDQRVNSVRALIKDTDPEFEQLQNEEIAFYLSQTKGDVYLSAAMACESLAALYARYGDTDIDGGVSVDYGQVSETYKALAFQMRRSSKTFGKTGIGRPRAGGISESGMRAADQDPDRVDPFFKRRQFRNPSSGNEDWIK
jgi:hypothetical protein